jgi:hypothetical protein
MAQHVDDAGDLRPWHFRMPGFQFIAKMPARFGDDFDPALDQPALALVGFEGLQRHSGHLAADELDRFDDVGKPWNRRRRRHQNTCRAEASIRSRRTGCTLRRVMMSVLCPRILSRRRLSHPSTGKARAIPRDDRRTNQRRNPRASPRAVDPNKYRCSTPSCRSSVSCFFSIVMASSRFMVLPHSHRTLNPLNNVYIDYSFTSSTSCCACLISRLISSSVRPAAMTRVRDARRPGISWSGSIVSTDASLSEATGPLLPLESRLSAAAGQIAGPIRDHCRFRTPPLYRLPAFPAMLPLSG